MKNIIAVLVLLSATSLSGCMLDEEVVNIRVHGYVRDKDTNDPIAACNIYILNEYIDEADEYIGETDINGYYDFRRDVWKNYATDISTACDIIHKDQMVEIDNNSDNEVNFYLEKY